MIRFECTRCDKLCKVPEDQVGQPTRCPACGEEQIVPRPWRTPKPRRPWWILPLVLGLIGTGIVGVWATRPVSPEHIRARVETELHTLSRYWKGTTWETCDPGTGDYRLSAFYDGEHGMYTFEVTCLPGTGQTYIRVDPRPQPPRWLAHAVFLQGQQESFDYLGKSATERDELEELTRDLADALHRALR
jgi:DNA-directed RNA polymerase subunit RPC12/RpoP